jgi:hypothetical protein
MRQHPGLSQAAPSGRKGFGPRVDAGFRMSIDPASILLPAQKSQPRNIASMTTSPTDAATRLREEPQVQGASAPSPATACPKVPDAERSINTSIPGAYATRLRRSRRCRAHPPCRIRLFSLLPRYRLPEGHERDPRVKPSPSHTPPRCDSGRRRGGRRVRPARLAAKVQILAAGIRILERKAKLTR